jgi:hypothetical protein
MLETVMFLFVIYQIKHFLADYPLQGKYMLGKFKPGFGFVLPLLAHVAVHGAFTFGIVFLFLLYKIPPSGDPIYSGLVTLASIFAVFDMTCHFIMDRIKASPKLLGRFKPLTASTYVQAQNMANGLSMIDGKPLPGEMTLQTFEDYKALGRKDLRGNTLFWWSLGLDQMVHHLTHYTIIYFLLRCL